MGGCCGYVKSILFFNRIIVWIFLYINRNWGLIFFDLYIWVMLELKYRIYKFWIN